MDEVVELNDPKYTYRLKMEVRYSSKKALNLCQILRRNILDNVNLLAMSGNHTAGNHEWNRHIGLPYTQTFRINMYHEQGDRNFLRNAYIQ